MLHDVICQKCAHTCSGYLLYIIFIIIVSIVIIFIIIVTIIITIISIIIIIIVIVIDIYSSTRHDQTDQRDIFVFVEVSMQSLIHNATKSTLRWHRLPMQSYSMEWEWSKQIKHTSRRVLCSLRTSDAIAATMISQHSPRPDRAVGCQCEFAQLVVL